MRDKDLRTPIAKARDEFILSDDGRKLCEGHTYGQYLEHRIELAFCAGWNAAIQRQRESGK